MKSFYGELKLGILGGGQLGRMLIQSSINYNVTTYVLDSDPDAPCKTICDSFCIGSLTDFNAVYEFGKKVDLLTIEIEKVNVDALDKLQEEGITIYPQPSVIRMIQDKGTQKEFFKKHHIPTAEFQLISNKKELEKLNWSVPYVQKLRKDGYDGKGVLIIRDRNELNTAFDAPSIAERIVDFEKEISVIVARNKSGAIKTFPVVEMEFHPTANLVEFLISPASISEFLQLKAENIAITIAEQLELVGILAVEMFVTKDDQILVNELAPRPHNSGHQTIEGNLTSQFDQHLRCIFNQPLGDTSSTNYAAMINILGDEEQNGLATYQGIEEVLSLKGVYIHLYGKKTTKPFRKMGHITVIDETKEEVIRKARLVKKLLKVTAN